MPYHGMVWSEVTSMRRFPGVVRWILMVAALLVGGIAVAATRTSSAGDGAGEQQWGIAELPLAARFAISRVLGQEDERYRAQGRPGGYGLENPAQGLSARLDAGGLELRGAGMGLRLALSGWGYGEAIEELGEAAPRAAGNWIEYRRGALGEWYVNGPLGLQQGFRLERPPQGARPGPLTLALHLEANGPYPTTLKTELDADARGLTLRPAAGGGTWRYAGLLAYDARGRELPAWMEVDGGALRLRVEDRGAAYPLVVDPFVQRAKLTASGGSEYDRFGFSVTMDGDTLVVWAYLEDIGGNANQGSAYVFVRPQDGRTDMTESAKLTASDGAGGDFFGVSVAIGCDTLVVGAVLDDIGGNADQGSAYVFGSMRGWRHRAS